MRNDRSDCKYLSSLTSATKFLRRYNSCSCNLSQFCEFSMRLEDDSTFVQFCTPASDLILFTLRLSTFNPVHSVRISMLSMFWPQRFKCPISARRV